MRVTQLPVLLLALAGLGRPAVGGAPARPPAGDSLPVITWVVPFELDSLLRHVGDSLGVRVPRRWATPLLDSLSVAGAEGSRADVWRSGRLPLRPRGLDRALAVRARRNRLFPLYLDVALDVVGTSPAERPHLARRLAAAARAYHLAAAHPVEAGGLVLTLDEDPPLWRGDRPGRRGALGAWSDGALRGWPVLAVETRRELACGLMLDTDLARAGDTLTLEIYGIGRWQQTCPAVYSRAGGLPRPLELAPGRYLLRVRWRGREDRHRLVVTDSLLALEPEGPGAAAFTEAGTGPRWRFLPNTVAFSCSAEAPAGALAAPPGGLCGPLHRLLTDSLGLEEVRYPPEAEVPYGPADALANGTLRLYRYALPDAFARVCEAVEGRWWEVGAAVSRRGATLRDWSGRIVRLYGEDEQRRFAAARLAECRRDA